MSKRKSQLLIDERLVYVIPTLAVWVGLNEAIFLQSLHYALLDKRLGKEVDGVKWFRNSCPEWEEEFPFWTDKVIKRTIGNLIGDGLLKTRDDLNQHGYDQTKWYTINYEKFSELTGPVPRIEAKKAKRRIARAASEDQPPDMDGGGDKMSLTIP